MRVVVTGGAGYVGGFAAERLLELGHEVTVLDNLWRGNAGGVTKEAQFINVDLRDADGVLSALREARPEAVMHFAAATLVGESMGHPRSYFGVNVVGIPLDDQGMRMDALEKALTDLRGKGVTPKYTYTIPTVQNPTATIMPEARRTELLKLSQQYGVPVFEDDCYADLIWDGKRPPAIYAMDKSAGVIHVGSFSKSIAPALRVGFIVAPWAMMSRMLALKTDAGSGALEQMVLAEYCAPHFATHVPKLTRGLRAKLDTLMEALNEQFGTAAEFEDPKGGIFLWIKLPDNVDTLKLYQAALAAGVAINPGPEWSTDKAYSGSRLRLCFASPSHEEIRAGGAGLAEVCRKEFGVPERSANVEKRAST